LVAKHLTPRAIGSTSSTSRALVTRIATLIDANLSAMKMLIASTFLEMIKERAIFTMIVRVLA